MQWCLEAVADNKREWLVAIESVPFLIGRADDCNLNLIDKHISRHHSEIRKSGDLLWIRDLKSTNGTYVNQKKIEQAHLLEPEDTISFGQYMFKLKKTLTSSSTAAGETMCETFSSEIDNLATIEPELRMLIRKRQVIPHFQPLLRFSDMAEIGFEILGRIDNKNLPFNVAELLDIADTLGCGSELSALFREVGVALGKDLPGSPMLFVNTTQLEILELDALQVSLQKIRNLAPSNKIVLEIHEKAAADTKAFLQLRHFLDEMDMQLAFDDFGVGQSRLVELAKISPDYLKFDMSLIREIHLAPKRLRQMVATFIKAAHDLGIVTLAEGVESPEESAVCERLGFDMGQGFLFGRPSRIDAIGNNLGATFTLS